MDVMGNIFCFLWLGLGVWIITLVLYAIIREQRQRRAALVPGEKLPPWYTNTIFRKQSKVLFYAVFAVVIIPVAAPFWNHDQSVMLWIALLSFLGACSIIVFLIYNEVGRRWIVRETGEELPTGLYRYHFHQRIAFAICVLGTSISALLNGLVFIKAQSAASAGQIDWLWGDLLLIGILSSSGESHRKYSFAPYPEGREHKPANRGNDRIP